ncbi:MAG: hypothetical protein Q4D89_03835 [Arachnia propionica]|uniref:hypothetical protein n=1 Tax=Arachnia propionica TaxID=1750 RepID=UPI0026F62C38|nr:hypothetical protein [Arachnia propionica]
MLTAMIVAVIVMAGFSVTVCWMDAVSRPGRLRREVMIGLNRSYGLPWPMTITEAGTFLAVAWSLVAVLILAGLWVGYMLLGRSPLILLGPVVLIVVLKLVLPRVVRLLTPRDVDQRHKELGQQEKEREV